MGYSLYYSFIFSEGLQFFKIRCWGKNKAEWSNPLLKKKKKEKRGKALEAVKMLMKYELRE